MPEDIQVEQPEQGSTVPEWVPEKFRSNPEDFGKSYSELEAKLTQTTQQLRAQQEQFEEFVASQETQQPEQAQDPSFYQASYEQIAEAMERDPAATTAWIAQQSANAAIAQYEERNKKQEDPADQQSRALLNAEYAERQVTARYPDWKNYAEQVSQEINDNPDLYPEDLFQTPVGIEKAITRAYKAVRLDALESNTTQTIEEQIAAQRHAKQQAQTLSGAAGRPAPTDSWDDRWSEIANAGNVSFRDIVS